MTCLFYDDSGMLHIVHIHSFKITVSKSCAALVSFLHLCSFTLLLLLLSLSCPATSIPPLWPRTNCVFLSTSWRRRAWWGCASRCRLWWTSFPPNTCCWREKQEASNQQPDTDCTWCCSILIHFYIQKGNATHDKWIYLLILNRGIFKLVNSVWGRTWAKFFFFF